MPHRRSYADPMTGAVTIALDQERDPALLALLAQHPLGELGQAAEFAADLLRQTLLTMSGTFTHEWAHILQGAAYPLLYLRAARGIQLLYNKWDFLAENPGHHPVPFAVDFHPLVHHARLVDTHPMTIRMDAWRAWVEPCEPGRIRRGTVSEKDLVEEDASIFQYRIERGGWGSGEDYRRWVTERSSYTAVFSFLSRHLSPSAAYALIPIAARIAFRTTRPLDALAVILGVARRELSNTGVITESDEGFWEFVLEGAVEAALGQADDSADWRNPAQLDQRGIIADARHADTVAQTFFMPLHLPARWNIEDGSVNAVLRRPWQHIARRGEALNADVPRLLPPVLVFELKNPPRQVMRLNSDIAVQPVSPDGRLMFHKVLPYLLMLKLMLDVQLGVRAPLRHCPHQACSYHGTGLCDGYFPIPRRHDMCRFPAMFEHQSRHRISVTGETLQPIKHIRGYEVHGPADRR